jgi:hypothetical protein
MTKLQKLERSEKGKSDTEKKNQSLDRAVLQIEKQYGKGTIMRLGSDVKLDVPVISTSRFRCRWSTTGESSGNLWT